MNSILFEPDKYGVDDLKHAIAGAETSASLARRIESGIPIYELDDDAIGENSRQQRIQYQTEWVQVLRNGAGALMLKNACRDDTAIDQSSELFESIIRTEQAAGGEQADHFGSNDRLWNSLQKLCLANPALFLRYHGCPLIDAVCESWLGPQYQMTAQLNVVRPGGEAQKAHRDYHLGFQGTDAAAAFPKHVHTLSPFLTLQGAIAHVNMPVKSGPTRLLPGSQRLQAGYVLWQREDFREHFENHFIQLPLEKGDVLIFNPAIFHAAGPNQTNSVVRMANLIQVSSAFGRAMETIDRVAMCKALYPALLKRPGMGKARIAAAINCCAEGYSFPTNLDTDPPASGAVPESQRDLLLSALASGVNESEFGVLIDEQFSRQNS